MGVGTRCGGVGGWLGVGWLGYKAGIGSGVDEGDLEDDLEDDHERTLPECPALPLRAP